MSEADELRDLLGLDDSPGDLTRKRQEVMKANQRKRGERYAHERENPPATLDEALARLSPKQAQFVRHYLSGRSAREAARLTGYSPSMGAQMVRQHPSVMAAVALGRKDLRERVEYDQAAATAELNDAIGFAKQTENATALVRALEIKSKLFGLLVERIDQRQVGSFQIQISGIDEKPQPIDAEVVTEGAR